jgi:hypothetical protein
MDLAGNYFFKEKVRMFASLVNNLFKTHVMHDWIEIDCFRYCECGTLEQCETSYSDSLVKWEDVSKNQHAISEFKCLADGMDISLN